MTLLCSTMINKLFVITSLCHSFICHTLACPPLLFNPLCIQPNTSIFYKITIHVVLKGDILKYIHRENCRPVPLTSVDHDICWHPYHRMPRIPPGIYAYFADSLQWLKLCQSMQGKGQNNDNHTLFIKYVRLQQCFKKCRCKSYLNSYFQDGVYKFEGI